MLPPRGFPAQPEAAFRSLPAEAVAFKDLVCVLRDEQGTGPGCCHPWGHVHAWVQLGTGLGVNPQLDTEPLGAGVTPWGETPGVESASRLLKSISLCLRLGCL